VKRFLLSDLIRRNIKRESRLIRANEPIRAIAFVSKPIDTAATLIPEEMEESEREREREKAERNQNKIKESLGA